MLFPVVTKPPTEAHAVGYGHFVILILGLTRSARATIPAQVRVSPQRVPLNSRWCIGPQVQPKYRSLKVLNSIVPTGCGWVMGFITDWIPEPHEATMIYPVG